MLPTFRLMALSRGGVVYRVVMGEVAYCLLIAKRRKVKGRAWIDFSARPALRGDRLMIRVA